MPSSKIKVRIAEILKTNGYIADFETMQVEGQVGDVLKVTLKYGESRERSIVAMPAVAAFSTKVPSGCCISRLLGS